MCSCFVRTRRHVLRLAINARMAGNSAGKGHPPSSMLLSQLFMGAAFRKTGPRKIVFSVQISTWKLTESECGLGILTGEMASVRMNRSHCHGSIPSRAPLLKAVLRFVRGARICQGVLRMALIGSLTTAKPLPKDADVLVTIEDGLDLTPLARAAPALEGNGAANEPMRRDISRSTSVECGIQYFTIVIPLGGRFPGDEGTPIMNAPS